MVPPFSIHANLACGQAEDEIFMRKKSGDSALENNGSLLMAFKSSNNQQFSL